MDSRVKLVNFISNDILKNDKSGLISNILDKVRRYDTVLDDTVRNFYEIKMDRDVPLFTLCEYLDLGKDNYALTTEEFKKEVDSLLNMVNDKFNVSYKLFN